MAGRLAVLSAAAVIGLAGCAGPAASPSAQPTAVPSVQSTLTASPAVSPTQTLAPTSSPTAQPALTFVATGSMHTAREGATATLLKNGKVLIAGGGNLADMYSLDITASAELYDPATGKFTLTGSMTAARDSATATLLSDGRVLIAGGEGCSNPEHCTGVAVGRGADNLRSAELYNPATGKFTRTGSMVAARIGATATVLSDGRVLMAGWTGWAELYDPSKGDFVRTGKETIVGGLVTATRLPNAKVLVTGVPANGGTVAQLYDEKLGTFATISLALPAGTSSSMYQGVAIDRQEPETATLLNNGRVLLFESGYLETYDPATGTCAAAGYISPAGSWDGANATLLPDGRVLFEGGGLFDPVPSEDPSTDAAVLYDPSGATSRTGSTKVARKSQTATLLPDGSVLIAGGQDSDYTPLASAELFKP